MYVNVLFGQNNVTFNSQNIMLTETCAINGIVRWGGEGSKLGEGKQNKLGEGENIIS